MEYTHPQQEVKMTIAKLKEKLQGKLWVIGDNSGSAHSHMRDIVQRNVAVPADSDIDYTQIFNWNVMHGELWIWCPLKLCPILKMSTDMSTIGELPEQWGGEYKQRLGVMVMPDKCIKGKQHEATRKTQHLIIYNPNADVTPAEYFKTITDVSPPGFQTCTRAITHHNQQHGMQLDLDCDYVIPAYREPDTIIRGKSTIIRRPKRRSQPLVRRKTSWV